MPSCHVNYNPLPCNRQVRTPPPPVQELPASADWQSDRSSCDESVKTQVNSDKHQKNVNHDDARWQASLAAPTFRKHNSEKSSRRSVQNQEGKLVGIFER